MFLAAWVDVFQADVVLVQGGIANAYDLFEKALKAQVPAVVHSALGSKAALLGAAALYFQND